MEKIHLKIPGIHCQGCAQLIKAELSDLSGIEKIEIDANKKEGRIEFEPEEIKKEQIFETLKKINYPAETISEEKTENQSASKGSIILVAILTTAIISIYFLIGRLGGWELLNQLNNSSVGYGLIFLIGLLASFHCLGMCGGIIAGYTLPDGGNQVGKRHLFYNLGRLISYSAMGALLGAVGSVFSFSPIINSAVMLLAGIFMLAMGASFISDNRWLKKIKIKTPDKVARIIYANKKNQTYGPLVIGLLTAFMPCGPLQAMELYALGTGSAWRGGLSLFIYALGTIPMLLGFGYFLSFWSRKRLELITKISGLVIIFLGFSTSGRALANLNQSWGKIDNSTVSQANKQAGYQTVEMSVTYQGFQPNVIHIKKGVPVKWIIRDQGITGCTNEIILYNDDKIIQKKLDAKENIIEFTPNREGEIKFSCWMKMVWGKFIASTDGQATTTANDNDRNTTSNNTCGLGKHGACNNNCANCSKKTEPSCGCGLK